MAGRPPRLVHRLERLRQGGPVELGDDVAAAHGIDEVDRGRDVGADRAQGEIADHADDLRGADRRRGAEVDRGGPAAPGERLADRVGGPGVAQEADGALVDHEGRLQVGVGARNRLVEHHVLAVGAGGKTACQGLQSMHLEEADVDDPAVHGADGMVGHDDA